MKQKEKIGTDQSHEHSESQLRKYRKSFLYEYETYLLFALER